MITYVKGDLFAANEPAIAHGCNCHGFMGAGVALLVKQQFPHAFSDYRVAVEERQFYPGVAQPVWCLDRETQTKATTVYNLATQNAPGANAKIEYVEAALYNMRRHMDHVGNRRIAMPKIGAGIGGLNWPAVEVIIDKVFGWCGSSYEYEVVVYSL